MGLLSAGLGLAGGIYGSIQQDKANKAAARANERTKQEGLGYLGQASDAADQGFAAASPFMQLMLQTAQGAGRDARGAIGRSTEAQLYGLGNRNRAAAAAGDARLGRSGLYNSSR